MSKVDFTKPLKRSDKISITISGPGKVVVRSNNNMWHLPEHTLQLLHVFAEPITVDMAIKKLGITDSEKWVNITRTIVTLCNMGVLLEISQNSPSTNIDNDNSNNSFGSPHIHIKMLNDTVRTNAFIKGIEAAVSPGDIVVDIGTGTGILAIAAARAGAKMVYAIEAGKMAEIAQETINKAGFQDRITLLRGWSTELELPEKADVLVSEIIGNNPLSENILPVFLDARNRFLKVGAKILPGVLQIFALPAIPDQSFLENDIIGSTYLQNWNDEYGIDFSHLQKASERPRWLYNLDPISNPGFQYAAKAILLHEIDLCNFTSPEIDITVEAMVEKPFSAIVIFFVTSIAGQIMTNDPRVAARATSWFCPVKHFPKSITMEVGEGFKLHYTYSSPKVSDLEILGTPN